MFLSGDRVGKIYPKSSLSFSFASAVDVSQVKTLLKINGSAQVEGCDYTALPLGGKICH